ncbi:putative gustatory receptor 58b [Lucilia cuprina]|nr:putative gustatory receptor 58b [Lucilia cuprina]
MKNKRVLGMLPGSYDWKTHQFSIKKSYLFYSGFIQLSFLSIIPLTSSFMHEKNNYMNNKPILQWSYMVGKCAMVTTVVVISLKIWQRRQGFIELCEIYERFVKRYENIFLHFRQHIIGEDFGKQEKRLKRFVIYKFISLHVHTLAVSSMYFQMQKNPDLEFVIMITVNMLQEALQQQRLPLNDLLKFYLVLYEMHLKCLKMSRLFFNASNTVTFFMLLKIFTSNIILLYHAVLTIMSSIPSTTISNFVGLICVVNFYWDSLLVTAAIDLVLVSAHRAMEILQGTWIIWKPEEDVDIFKKLTQLFCAASSSVIIQVIFLGITPLTSPYVEQENNFMENKPILQWTYLVGKVARILTIVVISGKIWMARQNLIQIYEFCYITYDLEKEDKRMQQLLLYKFLTLHLNSLVIQVILYHAALVLMSQIRSDNFVSLFGTLCIVNFYWDSFLNTVAIDKVLTSSSRTAEVLRETWITKDEVGDLQIYKKLTQVLNQFSDYLACNKLKFCIFGLVNFDKASSFSYFVAALLHLIILVQFD